MHAYTLGSANLLGSDAFWKARVIDETPRIYATLVVNITSSSCGSVAAVGQRKSHKSTSDQEFQKKGGRKKLKQESRITSQYADHIIMLPDAASL